MWQGVFLRLVPIRIPIFDWKTSDMAKTVWNLVGGLVAMFYFPIYWEFHHPNWRTHIFSEGWPWPTNQIANKRNGLKLWPTTRGTNPSNYSIIPFNMQRPSPGGEEADRAGWLSIQSYCFKRHSKSHIIWSDTNGHWVESGTASPRNSIYLNIYIYISYIFHIW